MTSLAYELEDHFSARAADQKDHMAGRVFKACAAIFAFIGDTLRSLGLEPEQR